MNWRNPKEELPKQGQRVWVMLAPHKDRGSLLESAMSIQVVCGEASYSTDGKLLEIQNNDELGEGAIGWSFEDYLKDSEYGDYQPKAIGWVPVEEMFPPIRCSYCQETDDLHTMNCPKEYWREV